MAAAGLDLELRHPGEVVRLMRDLHAAARDAIAQKSVAPLMARLYADLDATAARLVAVPVACSVGCSPCCQTIVAATAAEVLHVAAALDAARLVRVRDAAAAMARTIAGKTRRERAAMVTPCPLLEDDLCGAYAERPIACRTHASARADICARAHLHFSGEAIPRPALYATMRGAYHVAFAGALKQAGLAYRQYEYYAALDAALTAPDAQAAWLAGKDIFEGKADALGTDPFDDPAVRGVYEMAFGV